MYGNNPDWQKVIAAIDSNGDGQIDYDEFMTAAANRAKLLNKENLKAAFNALDSSGDGKITADELETAFSRGNLTGDLSSHGIKFNVNYWQKVMVDIDTNKDGEISFEEFETYMMDLIQQGGYLSRSGSNFNVS